MDSDRVTLQSGNIPPAHSCLTVPSPHSWDVVARWCISCRELEKLLNSDTASVSRQDFHAVIETTILKWEKRKRAGLVGGRLCSSLPPPKTLLYRVKTPTGVAS